MIDRAEADYVCERCGRTIDESEVDTEATVFELVCDECGAKEREGEGNA